MKSSYLPEDAARLFASLAWRSNMETVGIEPTSAIA
jgi:hypothetical protein